MHQSFDSPQAPSRELTIATVGRALAQLTYEDRKGPNPRVDEKTYAEGLIKLFMGDWAPKRTNDAALCPLSVMVGQALATAMFIRATSTDESHITRGGQDS
jgi:hypothetical protein